MPGPLGFDQKILPGDRDLTIFENLLMCYKILPHIMCYKILLHFMQYYGPFPERIPALHKNGAFL